MTRTLDGLVFIGIKGSVLALDRATGKTVWEKSLKGSDFVNVMLDGGDLFASARGEMFCLDPMTGRVRWNNGLKGLGWGLVSISTINGSAGFTPLAEKKRQDEANAAASSSVVV